MRSAAVEGFAAKVEGFEGLTDWLYLCSRGMVTTGYGKVLASVAEAQQVAFHVAGRPATPGEIAEDWTRIRALGVAGARNAHAAAWFATFTRIRLAEGEARRLLLDHLEGNEAALRRTFRGYGTHPPGVQLALLDMIYNLGEAGLRGKFPRFCRAVRQRRWEEAAAESERRDVQPARNAWVRGLLEAAAREAAQVA